MSKPFMFEKPLGMRDTLPSLYEDKKQLKNTLSTEINNWGYQFIQTPTLEYYETIGQASAILDRQLFKLLDQQGHTLVLRPDMTAPIARVAASRLLQNRIPLRLAYEAPVFRAQQREAGRPAEFEQMGVECIGDQSPSADAEMIALLISLLQQAGLTTFTIAIGHIGFVQKLLRSILGTEKRAATLRKFLYEKNYVGYREHLQSLSLSSIDESRLMQLLQVKGDKTKLAIAAELVEETTWKELEEIKTLFTLLESYGVADYVKLDFTLVAHMNYYTGIIFEAYAENVSYPIGNGGRYDQLYEKFDHLDISATGFGLYIDRLLEAKGTNGKTPEVHCVIFSKERIEEALQFTKMKRRDGERVVMQDISGVQNVDAFTTSYDEVSFFIGKEKEGMST
ncbi:ATP phosphoribosyltransferase regulatory subunit [Bacillus sp. FJAT-45066]|uniref:ATP phosphoribosyltransferase regulatory subunit n=1 Tax=Bacillus sp. FJAT-45066 TaxID=2011010 RepID=UPI000BB69513|nr:ATP phosphoribosyltransferase regulatory subunit [Bacillus sp. FJAT-45066]